MKKEHNNSELLSRIEELERALYEIEKQSDNVDVDVSSLSDKTIDPPWEREGYETKERWLNEKRE